MKIGVVVLPQFSHREAVEKWKALESMGFRTGWTYDHLAWRDLADEPWHATVPFLAAAATATTTLRLGTWVTSPNFRHPVTLAKDLMTLDDISDGRIIAGIGAGGTGWDAVVLDQNELSAKQRMDRLVEFVTLTDLLLREPRTTWRGEYFSAVDARMIPGCVQKPRLPFVIAANGPRGMKLAAASDAWVTTGLKEPGDTTETWWATTARLADTFAGISGGKDMPRYLSVDSAPEFSLSSIGTFLDAVERARALGFTDLVVHWPRQSGEYAGSVQVLEQVAALLDDTGAIPA